MDRIYYCKRTVHSNTKQYFTIVVDVDSKYVQRLQISKKVVQHMQGVKHVVLRSGTEKQGSNIILIARNSLNIKAMTSGQKPQMQN